MCVTLFLRKTRLASVRGMDIPKLEFMAVVIGVRSLLFVKEQLKIEIIGSYLWTESMAVIGWINSLQNWPIFVKNRVIGIKGSRKNMIF